MGYVFRYTDIVSVYPAQNVIIRHNVLCIDGDIMTAKQKLLDQVCDQIRLKHYSLQTEKSYIGWIKRYIFFHQKKHPVEMGKEEIEAFLTYLAVERNVSASALDTLFDIPALLVGGDDCFTGEGEIY